MLREFIFRARPRLRSGSLPARDPRPAPIRAVQVTTFGCFTGTVACLPFAGQLPSQLGAPYNPRGHNLRRSRPSRHEDQRARRMITGTVDLVREDY